jgi:hypothetical protein
MGSQGGVPGRADLLELGTFNAACSMCGRKRKASQLVRNWQGLYRCPEHNEPRQPQDFARGVKDDMSVPWNQHTLKDFVLVNAQVPVYIIPNAIQLLLTSQDLALEGGGGILTTEGGSPLALEGVKQATAEAIVPAWVIIDSILWSWASGGGDITIGSPTSLITTLATADFTTSGILQCAVTSSLGAVGIATVNVST